MKTGTIPTRAKAVLIAQNPKSGASNQGMLVQKLADRLTSANMSVQIFQNIDELVRAANEKLTTGELRAVVSAGGDGTVSLLVNKLPPAVPFYVFPLGTANLLAKYLKTTSKVEEAAATILNGETTCLDVGQANGKLFLVVASCGFDADVVHRIHSTRQGHINYLSYLFPVAKSIFGYRFPKMKFLADENRLPEARWAFVFNVPRYAVGLQFVENASGQDGMLDICSFSGGGFVRGLVYFFAVLFRQHSRLSTTNFSRFSKLEIEPVADVQIPVELDGDPAGFLPVTIETIPERLCVIVDKNWSA